MHRGIRRTAALPLIALVALPVLTTACVRPTAEPRTTPRSSASASSTQGAPATATAPAADGAPLGPLAKPPERSLWALSTQAYRPGATVRLEFTPYGIGPSAYGRSVVVRVTDAEAEPGSVPELAGRNVVLGLGKTKVVVGGRYKGTAVTRLVEDRIVFELTRAERISAK